MEEEQKFYCYDYYFNEDEFCFYLEDKLTKYEDIFNNQKNKVSQNNEIYVEKGNYIYPLKNPGYIQFLFPDGKNKTTFISSSYQIIEILTKYKKHDFFYSKNGEDNYTKFLTKDLIDIYPVKKIKITLKNNAQIYQSNNKIINDYSCLTPKDLAFSFVYYLKYSENISSDKKFFNYTNQRRDFYNRLDTELKSQSFIPLCGPEGIGKTASILGYCRMRIKFGYFYCNIRVFSKLLIEKKYEKIEKLLLEELSHCVISQKINQIIEKVMNIQSFPINSMEFLIHILAQLDSLYLLVIDQYKAALDEDYYYLHKLLAEDNKCSHIICLNSINEDDVKGSIIKGIQKEHNSKNKFLLDYLYIGELVEVSKEDSDLLNNEEQNILQLFGNLYSIFYDIQNLRKNNKNNFKKNFIQKIQNDIQVNIKKNFKDKDYSDIYFALSKLIDLELNKLDKFQFLQQYVNIPFRYIRLKIDNNNIFKISEINEESKFEFSFIYNCLGSIFTNIKAELYKKIETQDNNMIPNVKKSLKPIKFEDNVFHYIWGNREFWGITIKKKILVNSIFNLSNEDIKKIKKAKKELKINEGIIFAQDFSNAIAFDTGLLVKKNDKLYKLILIQITTKKQSKERLTLLSLNDYFGFFKGYLKENCKISISDCYFCYIFDDKSKDMPSVNYCIDNNIDYKFYNNENYELIDGKNILLKEYKMKKNIIFNNENIIIPDNILEIEKFYPKTNKFMDTKNYLKRKRELMKEKNLKEYPELEERIGKKVKYYDSIKQNYNKKIKIDNNNKEIEIKKYLLDKEFNQKDLVGIQLLIPNQKDSILQLKKAGLSDNQIENFYDLIELSKDKYLFLNIKLFHIFIPSYYIPEYMTYILIITNKEIYYQDYVKKKAIDLSTKVEYDFIYNFINDWKYIAVSFINKNMAKEKLPLNKI